MLSYNVTPSRSAGGRQASGFKALALLSDKAVRITIMLVLLAGIASTSWAALIGAGSISYDNGLYAYGDHWTQNASVLSWNVSRKGSTYTPSIRSNWRVKPGASRRSSLRRRLISPPPTSCRAQPAAGKSVPGQLITRGPATRAYRPASTASSGTSPESGRTQVSPGPSSRTRRRGGALFMPRVAPAFTPTAGPRAISPIGCLFPMAAAAFLSLSPLLPYSLARP